MAVRQMTVALGPRERLEPDILLVERAAFRGHVTSFRPQDVRLVVEVVSEGTPELDRTTKPIRYANAGIKHFWRIEQEDDMPVAYTFGLEPSVRAYVPTGIHRKRLQTSIGFDVDIDLDLRRVAD